MNTFIKKITSAVAAASIMASSIAGLCVTAYAADTYTVTFDYGDGRSEQVIVDAGAVVQELPEPPSKKIIEIDDNAAHDGTAMLIRAEYAEEGELNAVSMSEMTLLDGQTELELPSDGGTYMLWDSLESMTPLGTEDEKSSVWVYDGILFTKDTPVWNDITVTAVYGYEPSVPTETPGTTAQPTARPDYAETRSFVFGADGEGALTVLADTAYGEQANGMTYGLIDIDENSAMNDFRFDGFTDDVLTYVVNGETGGAGYVTADYSHYDEETLAAFGDGVVPVRFAAEAETGAYYTVSATIVNTSGTESTEASLFGENRYAVLYNHKLAPGESVTRTWNVNLVGQYYNATGAYIDTAVNVAAAGKNVGLVKVEIHKHKEPGKTIWLMTDSTGDNSSAELPYFGLRGKCGVGQMLTKYLSPDIAVNNQGEGGLNSSDTAHFNNALQYMKEGDYLYIQYGFNGETTESLLKNLPRYYSAANERGVKMIVASTTERQSSSFWDSETGKWNASNAAIAAAGKQYVEGLVADGAKDIAFIDLNTAMNEWMNKTTADIYEQRVRLGFEDSAPSRLAMNYYYGFDRDSGVDSIHINDAGADNAAYLVMSEIRKTVDAGGTRAEVLRELTLNAPDSKPYTIPDGLASKGWVPNDSYPYPLPSDVAYEYPTIVKDIDIENGQLVSIEVMVQGDMQYYALGAADILDADGNVINTVYSVSTDVNPFIGHIDNTACSYGQIYKMYFENVAVGEGQTVRAYTAALQSGETEPTGERYSSYYTEEPVEKVLLDETFANGAEGWLEGGSSAVKETVTVTKDGKNALKLYQNGSGTYNVYKRFDDNAEVSNGIIRLWFMLCHEYGSYTLKLTPRTSSGSYIEGLKLIDVKDGTLLLQNGTEIGRIKTGKWTDVECRVDLLNGTVTASVAGGTPVTEENDLLRSESTEELTDMLPFKGMAVAYMSTGSTIPSYSFETYITELTAELLQCELPSFTVTAGVEESCADFGTVEGGGEYAINETVTLKARAEDGYEFVGWYDGNGNEVSARSEYSFRVRGDKALYARFEEEVYDPNVTKWSFSQFKDGEEIIADDENQVEYNGMVMHVNSGDSITEDGLYWNAPGGTKSDSTTTVTNNRYIEFVPERSGTISITFKASKESDRNYPRLYISCGESLDCTTKDASAAQLEGNRQFDNKEGDGQYATMTAELTAGMRYYIWAYYYSRPAANFTISEIVYTAEPGTTVEPTQTPGGEDTGEPVWDFSKYAGDASVTTDGELSLDYIEGGQTLEVHLNSGDSMTENGLVWTAPGSTTSDGKTVTNNRYIMYTPSTDGTLRLTFSGDKRNSSSKAPRIYVVPGEAESCMSKTNSDANGVQQTAAEANTDTELAAQLSAGKTYYIWPYYYNDSSVSFTVSNIVFEKAEAAVSTRNIYGSNMLLQRGEPVVIDGKADAADAVTVTLTNETTGEDVQTVTGAAVAEDGAWNGKDWSVTLDAVSDYESSYKLTISAEGAETVEYTNILFGDLYLFTGQSNMWKQVSYYKNIDSEAYGTAAVAANVTDKIRVMHTAGSGDYGTAVLQYDALNAQPWRDFSTYENVSDISAPAYTAAVTMYKETGVPIGIITNAYPGSYISSWFDSALAIDACNLGKNGSANERNWYCGRIYPLRNLRLSGIFWYQGEADAAKTYHDDPYSYYSQMLPKLIDSWRELFADDTLPFYYVQLSRIGTTIVDENNPDTGAAGKMPIKLAQTDVYLAMEDKTNVGIISTLDLYGNHDAEGTANCRTDIHLGQKDVIGKRMAAYALQDIYGKDTYADGSAVYVHGPIYKSSAVKDGKIEITFECSGQLRIMPSEQYTDTEGERLISEGVFDPAKLNEFELAGEDGVWHEAEAEITGTDTVTVSSQEVPAPVKVRYCGRDYPESPNLTDDSGLPSYVFEKTAAAEEPSPTATAEPSETPGAEIAATYKFDFGSGAAAEGWTAVTPDMVYDMSASEDAAEGALYGFLGTTETSYNDDVLPYDCDSRAIDGFSLVKGQQIVLTAGGDDSKNDAASDYIAVPEKSSYLPSNASEYEGRFPIRFSMKAENGSYYTVTATIANASDTEKACVSLFSEKRQIVAEDVVLAPGERISFTFSVDVEEVCYKTFSETFKDNMLNVCVTGENAALASLAVEKHAKKEGTIRGNSAEGGVNDGVTLWACTDSTGCDCPATVPFFALQNYAGVAQAFVKYMPEDIAVSNQGERGLASGDNAHLNRCMLKPGDYLYVEYGHNESGTDSYKANLEKYYTLAHKSGAKLIIASPVNRHNNYTAENGWTSDFTSYIAAADAFVKEKIDGGADDIAFVDLNTLYVEWMNEETSRITALNPSLSPSQAMDFYYRSVKGSSVDGTHLNDAGADRAAYCFFEAARDIVAAADSGAADKYVLVQANVLRPIAEGMKTKIGDSDTDNLPMTVADEIIAQGNAPNAFWDTVPSDAMEYDNSIAVDSVGAVTNSDGSVTIDSVGIRLMNSGVMYAKAVVTVTEKDAQTVYYTESNYDCTGDEAGTVKVNSGFITSDKPHDEVTDADRVETITIPAGAECEIQIVSCDDKWTVGDSPEIYSAPYGIYPEQAVIFDENCSSSEGWGRLTGAAEYSETVESDADGSTYLSIISSNADANGTKKNYGFYKELNESLSTGRYRLSFKTRFGSGAVRFALATSVQSASNPFPQKVYVFGVNGGSVYMNEEKNAITTYINDSGTEENAIRANEWINIDSIIDLDRGKVLISAAGSDYAEFDIASWQTNFPSSLPLRYFGIAGSSDGTPTDVDISDIRMVRIPQDCSESRTVRVAADSAMGTVYIDGEPLVEKSVPVSSSVTLKASAAEGYRFTGWIDAEGNILSESAEYVIPRLYNDISVTAGFEALAEGEKAWDFSKYTEAVAADEPMQLEYDGLEIHLGSGDSVTDGGIYWATPGGVKADGITTVSNNRYIVYTPEVSGTLSVTFSGSQYHSKSKAPRVYVISGDDTSCMTKNNSDSGASATATAANTPTVVTAELEAGKTYYIWAYYYGDSRTAFTVSNMGFSPAE